MATHQKQLKNGDTSEAAQEWRHIRSNKQLKNGDTSEATSSSRMEPAPNILTRKTRLDRHTLAYIYNVFCLRIARASCTNVRVKANVFYDYTLPHTTPSLPQLVNLSKPCTRIPSSSSNNRTHASPLSLHALALRPPSPPIPNARSVDKMVHRKMRMRQTSEGGRGTGAGGRETEAKRVELEVAGDGGGVVDALHHGGPAGKDLNQTNPQEDLAHRTLCVCVCF